MYNSADVEDSQRGDSKHFQFNSISIRQAFIRKVYSILLLQLLVTFGTALLFTLHAGLKKALLKDSRVFLAVAIPCLVVVLVLSIVLACCTKVRRKHPYNLVFLFVYTLAMAVLVGLVCMLNEQKHVLMAAGITTGIVLGLTLFAFQTKYDFTRWGTYLFVLLLVFMLTGILMGVYRSNALHALYSGAGALLFSFYLVFDTQLLLGNGALALSPEEYVFAALTLFTDIINIFLYILDIFNRT